MKDFYYILGAERNCTPAELNAAYSKLAQKLQPAGQEQDHFLDGHFQEITEAYLVLSDPIRRKKYDTAFKKSYQRRLYYFKIRYLNVAAMLTLIGFTALFGYYVMSNLKSSKAKTPVIANVLAPSPIVKHRKKKKVTVSPVVKTTPAKAIAPPAPVIKTLAKPQVVEVVQPVVNHQNAVQAVPAQPPSMHRVTPEEAVDERAYTSELLANVTGLVSLHQTANYRSPVLASIPNHAKVQVLERGGNFYKIAFKNQTGYVPKWTVVTP